MSRHRILVHAGANAHVADLVDLAWSCARWLDAQVEAYVSAASPLAAIPARLGRARPGDLLIAELPAEPAVAHALARALARDGHRALLLPPRRGARDRLFGGWLPDAAADPTAGCEAAMLAIAVEQHLRWRGGAPRGHLGDPISTRAAEAALNGAVPSWPEPPAAIAGDGADRLRLRAHGAADGTGAGWIVVPRRPGFRLGDALDAGDVALVDGRRRDDPAAIRVLAAIAADAAPRFALAPLQEDARGRTMLRLRAASLLDPGLHQAWEAVRELLSMPRLRADLLAAGDADAVRGVLLLDERGLVGAGSGP